jgi:glycine/D-amino acid oxidase-like deaminating enzyme
MTDTAELVICGAGIAGAATAYHLAVKHRQRGVVIVDEREPLTLTSDKGTQGYRNWWPGPDDTMFRHVSRSIDLLEESAITCGNAFRLSRRGYLFATASESQATTLEQTARTVSAFGMGELRIHRDLSAYDPGPAEGFLGLPTGADLLLGDAARRALPYLMKETVAALHVRRAGWFSGLALGSWLLEQACAAGARIRHDRMTAVDTSGGRVTGVRLASGERIATDRLVVAAGPQLPQVARMLGAELPIVQELHAKLTIRDPKRAVPRDAPFVIWTDPMTVGGKQLPGGVHVRPVDLVHGDELFLIWTLDTEPREFAWPAAHDAGYGALVLEGCARMVPALRASIPDAHTGMVDGGYYCKTPENRPLIGPMSFGGAFVVGALSGTGLMSAHASGELVANHVMGAALPDYARWFLPSRYDDPEYRALMKQWGPLVGQL